VRAFLGIAGASGAPRAARLLGGLAHGAETVDDLLHFAVARRLGQLGLEHALSGRWGT